MAEKGDISPIINITHTYQVKIKHIVLLTASVHFDTSVFYNVLDSNLVYTMDHLPYKKSFPSVRGDLAGSRAVLNPWWCVQSKCNSDSGSKLECSA